MSTDIPSTAPSPPVVGGVLQSPDLLVRYLVTVLLFLLPTLLIAGLISYSQPDRYVSSSTILPQVPYNPTASISAQMGIPDNSYDAARLGRIGTTLLLDRFKIILRSRTVGEGIIDTLHLTQRSDWMLRPAGLAVMFGLVEQPAARVSRERALGQLRRQLSFEDSREGILTVSASGPDPQWSARLANAYVDGLNHFLNSSVLSAVKRGRIFIENQLQKTRAGLASAEEALRSFQAKHRTVALPEQTRAAVEAGNRVAEQIAEVEVNLGVKSSYLTEQDKDIMLLRQRLAELRRRQQHLVNGGAASASFPSYQLTLDAIPAVGVELVRLQRNVATQEKIHGLLTEQLELAKIIESREDISFQVIDAAIPPRSPVGRRSPRTMLAAGLLAVLAAVFYRVLRTRLEGPAAMPERF